MIVIFDSLTGQTKRFAKNLGFNTEHIKLIEDTNEEIFLVTRSINFGQIPDTTINFLETHKDKVIGCAVSGNKNWGDNFGKAGDKIEAIYNIPLVLKFEGSGFKNDIEFVKTWILNRMNRKEA